MNKKPLIYIDTSVIGGLFDEEFQKESQALFGMANKGELTFLISDLILAEIEMAPKRIKDALNSLPEESFHTCYANDETVALRNEYLAAKVVGPSSEDDAHHVAIATIMRADMMVSWNFRHIVHFEKIRGFNSVNICLGYGPIEIFSPKEVV